MDQYFTSTSKADVLEFAKAVDTALGYPRYEGHWAGGGVHVPGTAPDGQGLLTERYQDIVERADAKAWAYRIDGAVEQLTTKQVGEAKPAVAVPSSCTTTTLDATWKDAAPVKSALVAEQEATKP